MGTVGEWLGNGRGMSQGVAGAAIERLQRGERRIARRAKADGGETSPRRRTPNRKESLR